jgi:hypothetical protein
LNAVIEAARSHDSGAVDISFTPKMVGHSFVDVTGQDSAGVASAMMGTRKKEKSVYRISDQPVRNGERVEESSKVSEPDVGQQEAFDGIAGGRDLDFPPLRWLRTV